ncbi:hypothetical protein FAZ15_04540 [Sphingobacterium olei]|uniref:TonB-dependent receptor n=1 Tax=Sphingobacterium olei TaxID=2571155 RepID=A0A4U0P3Q2_9SPHI|nr:hypothetical protein [Sphingobacterium olei]TJZ61790.1 hypothetical protein FAZ15_04540 [Sphingobacterium olei]
MIKIVFSFFLLIGINPLYGQHIEQVLRDAREHHELNLQEKLYLHLDKPTYTAGETIWIKVYCTVGVENLLSNLSGITDIELIDPAHNIVSAIKIPLVMGMGIADIQLNDTITEGSYRLRAYTSWMRNADEQFFYDRTLHISNGRSDNVLTATTLHANNEKGTTYAVDLKTMSGVPLQDIPVQFEVLHNGKVVEKKKQQTDGGGVTTVLLNHKYEDAIIRYSFETPEKLTINKFIKPLNIRTQNCVQLLPEGE